MHRPAAGEALITAEWHKPKPWESRGTAWGRGRNARVRLPHIRSAVEFAICLHEIGHTLAEPCEGAGHLRAEGRGCVRCEHLAWGVACQIAPFSRRMHEELRHCLGTYRRSTNAAPGELQHLDRISGTVAWALDVQRRKKAQMDAEGRQRFAALMARQARARRS